MSFTLTSELCTVLYMIFSTLLTGLIDTALQYALQLPVYGSVCGQGRNKFCVPFCVPHVDARLPSPHVRHLLSGAHRIERTVDDMTRLALRIYETTRSVRPSVRLLALMSRVEGRGSWLQHPSIWFSQRSSDLVLIESSQFGFLQERDVLSQNRVAAL